LFATLAAQLVEVSLSTRPLEADLVVPVPLSDRRQRERGYNQSELIARELARSFRLPPPLAGLCRTRDTAPQVGLDRLHRYSNVSGAFAWRGPPLRGEPLLLIDDVATTGATLEACAAALKGAGSGSITGLTLARVRI
jgi:ComF family protein